MARRKNLSEDARMPRRESMGKGGSKKEERLDMSKVEELKTYQKKRNSELNGTGLKCNLNPKKDLKSCQGCSFYEECKKARVEREYINQCKHTTVAVKRRTNADNKAVMEEKIMQSHEVDEYPCEEEFMSICPKKEICNGVCYYKTTE